MVYESKRFAVSVREICPKPPVGDFNSRHLISTPLTLRNMLLHRWEIMV